MNEHRIDHLGNRSPLTLSTRRGLLKVSLGSALGALLAPSLPTAFGADNRSSKPTNAKSVILIWLQGGPFQHDSFDPKESRDDDLALKFGPIPTTAPNIKLASCLPKLAQQAQHLAIIRSMSGLELEHNLAIYHTQTGYRNSGPIRAPSIGSIVSHELGATTTEGLPAYISISHPGHPSGYFGPAYKPTVIWDPTQPPQNLGLPEGVSPEIFQKRLRLLQAVESGAIGDSANALTKRFESGRDAAVRFMSSKYRVAFDLEREPPATRTAYGETKFGKGCLLARRLIETGVRFVQVCHENFDQHTQHYPKQTELFQDLDHGMAMLINDLKVRGLLDQTIVVAAGEFGRTPKMNSSAGRDHWVNGYSIALAGGGFKGGYTYGSTLKKGQDVDENPVSVPDFLATLCTAVGLDPETEYHDELQRPIKLVDNGQVIDELLA